MSLVKRGDVWLPPGGWLFGPSPWLGIMQYNTKITWTSESATQRQITGSNTESRIEQESWVRRGEFTLSYSPGGYILSRKTWWRSRGRASRKPSSARKQRVWTRREAALVTHFLQQGSSHVVSATGAQVFKHMALWRAAPIWSTAGSNFWVEALWPRNLPVFLTCYCTAVGAGPLCRTFMSWLSSFMARHPFAVFFVKDPAFWIYYYHPAH